MSILINFLTHKLFIAGILSVVIVQIIKVFVHAYYEKKINPNYFLTTGGMPSSHSSFVASLTTMIFLFEGLSNLFFVALVFSLIIIRDATGIRFAAGRNAEVINQLLDELKINKKLKEQKLKVILGHTRRQVIVGTLIGIIIATGVFYLW